MAISVTCPGCLTRFSVSDKFAGKSGPCPKCRKTIKIPELADEVVIHAPEEDGPKDSKGRSVLKPLRRSEVAVSMPVVLAVSLSAVVLFGVALGLGLSGDPPPTWLLAITSLAVAFPVAVLGYWFLRDDELEGYTGKSLYTRAGIVAAAFAIAWGIYAWVPQYVSGYESMAEISFIEMAIYVPILLAIGTAAAVIVFEFEVAQGIMLYMLYFALTFALAWLSGSPLGEALPGNAPKNTPIVKEPTPSSGPPTTTPPPAVTPPPTETPPTEDPDKPKIPNLLQ